MLTYMGKGCQSKNAERVRRLAVHHTREGVSARESASERQLSVKDKVMA